MCVARRWREGSEKWCENAKTKKKREEGKREKREEGKRKGGNKNDKKEKKENRNLPRSPVTK